jgi:hypothetical protein
MNLRGNFSSLSQHFRPQLLHCLLETYDPALRMCFSLTDHDVADFARFTSFWYNLPYCSMSVTRAFALRYGPLRYRCKVQQRSSSGQEVESFFWRFLGPHEHA